MISLILWFKFDGSPQVALEIQRRLESTYLRDNRLSWNFKSVQVVQTSKGWFMVARKCWDRVLMSRFVWQNIYGDAHCSSLSSQGLLEILSKIEVETNIPFRQDSIRQYRDSDPDLKVWEEDTLEGNLKLCMNIPDASKIERSIQRFTQLTYVFLETAAMYHYATQALMLLDKGGAGSLAGVRKKLESIRKIAHIEYGNDDTE